MDLKRNTISQSKFPTSRMSPALQHTPVQGASSNQISDTEMYQYQEQKNPNIQPYTSKTGTKTKESDSPWKNTKQMLDFDTINLDGSIFKDDPDSETENEKEKQTQIKPIKWNLHNGPPTSSLDREIQIHHNRQADSSTQSASGNHARIM